MPPIIRMIVVIKTILVFMLISLGEYVCFLLYSPRIKKVTFAFIYFKRLKTIGKPIPPKIISEAIIKCMG